MPRIMVSYRRSDSAGTTGRISEKLGAHFGEEGVFIDIDNIPLGIDYRDHIREVLSESDVVLAVIGTRWLDEQNKKRLHDPDDLVRIEIETALEKGIPLIPVRVDDAAMPMIADLPETLKRLVYINSAEIDPGRDFRVHMERLIRSIEKVVAIRSAPARIAPVAATDARPDESQGQRVARSVPAPAPEGAGEALPARATQVPAEQPSIAADGRPRDADWLEALARELGAANPAGDASHRSPEHAHPVPDNRAEAELSRAARPTSLDADRRGEAYRPAQPDRSWAPAGADDAVPSRSRRSRVMAACAAILGAIIVVTAVAIGYRHYAGNDIATTDLPSAPTNAKQPMPTAAEPPKPTAVEVSRKPFQDRLSEGTPNVLGAPEPPRVVLWPPAVDPNAAPPEAKPGSMNEPRRVRTMIIRPDASATNDLSPSPANPPALSAPVRSVRPAPGGLYGVQVASQRTESEAQASYRGLQAKYPSILGSVEANIRRSDLGDKGVYYRASIGPFNTVEEANTFCGNLKAAGGQCIVQRN